jgi:hypothetical protein
MNSGLIVLLIFSGIVVLSLLFIVVLAGHSYRDDLNKKLSALLEMPIVADDKVHITGVYHDCRIKFEWGQGMDPLLWLNILIDHPIITALESDFSPNTRPDSVALWNELSEIASLKKFGLVNHTLQVKMEWGGNSKEKKAEANPPSAALDNDQIGHEVGTVLDKVAKILQLPN